MLVDGIVHALGAALVSHGHEPHAQSASVVDGSHGRLGVALSILQCINVGILQVGVEKLLKYIWLNVTLLCRSVLEVRDDAIVGGVPVG